jgi:hypothetical protein
MGAARFASNLNDAKKGALGGLVSLVSLLSETVIFASKTKWAKRKIPKLNKQNKKK